ncbi:MAG: PilN domain-containing protein, partial [Gammaproteobacteria bacterium]
MARINLLPWRERRREQQRKEFLAVLGGVAAAGFGVVVLVHLLISGQIDYQTQRNEYLQGEISKLDRQVAEIKD